MSRFCILVIVTILFSLLLSCATQQQPDELNSLSIKELLNISISPKDNSVGIFQSDINQISNNTFNLGLLAPFTAYTEYSAEATVAADLAANLINQNGGVQGKRLVIIRADETINSPETAELAKILVDRYKVKGLIGPGTSVSAQHVLSNVVRQSEVALITQAASSVALSNLVTPGKFWRLVANNNQQVRLFMDHVVRDKGHNKVYIIAGRDLASEEILNGIKHYQTQNASLDIDYMKISGLVQLEIMDLSEEIKEIQKRGFSSIVITLPFGQMHTMIRKIGSVWNGPFPFVLATDVAKPTYLLNADLGPITGCIGTYLSAPTQLNTQLKESIESKLDTVAAAYDAAYIYDAVILMAMAFQVSHRLGISFEESMRRITSSGLSISDSDYPNIVDLINYHGKLSYSGYSGRILFDVLGDNVTANLELYLLKDFYERDSDCINQVPAPLLIDE